MQKSLILSLFIFIGSKSFCQSSFFTRADTLNKGRFVGISVGIGSAWSGSMIGLWQVWYKNVEKSKWHNFDDSRNWLQMDKVGHFYTAHKLNMWCTDMYRWTGYDGKRSLWIGTGISLGYQTTLEIFDAYSADWGFSWSDFAANAVGTASYLTQDLLWEEERIIPKFSYHPTEFPGIRSEVLGTNSIESLLKDYNGQTYWLSINAGKFAPESKIPKWLCFSVGYSVNQKLAGSEEIYIDPANGFPYHSQREFLFSLDIDFSALNIKRPWLRVVVKQLNYLKIPFPTLLFRDQTCYLKPLYF